MIKSILNIDFIYLAGYTGTMLSFPNSFNPYVVFIGGIIAILVGLANLIRFAHWWKHRNKK